MPNIPAIIAQDIVGVGSSERFTPTPLNAQFLSGGLLPYLTQQPSFINQPTENNLTLGSAQQYNCDFNYNTYECNNLPLPPTSGFNSILTSNYPSEIARQQAIFKMDNQVKTSFADQLKNTNIFVLIGLPFLLFFVAKKFLK